MAPITLEDFKIKQKELDGIVNDLRLSVSLNKKMNPELLYSMEEFFSLLKEYVKEFKIDIQENQLDGLISSLYGHLVKNDKIKFVGATIDHSYYQSQINDKK